MKKNQSYSKLAKMARKFVGIIFELFLPPTRKFFWAKKGKNQSSSKLAKMARKLVGNNFEILPIFFCGQNEQNQSCSKLAKNWSDFRPPLPPPQLGKKKCVYKNSILFQIGRNGEKICQK